MSPDRRLLRHLATLLPWLGCAGLLGAQDIEPRRWTHLPVGSHILGVGYVYTQGELRLEPASRIQDADVEMHTVLLSYNHYWDLFGNTARVDLLLPFQHGRWEGLLDGAPAATSREGLGDPLVRLSVNLVGAPALAGREFVDYTRSQPSRTTVGAAVGVRLPLGEYYEDRLINLGQNRYTIETQIGVLHTVPGWSYEVTGSVFVFTDNDEFFGGTTLEQDPLYAVQAHVVRTFPSGAWLAAGAAYGFAGQSVLGGGSLDDDRRNLLYGASFGLPIGGAQSVRIGYVRGDTFADVGMDSHSLLLTWAIRL
ncbi:MAG: transporter [Planctomycetes bacterium]|nr:transporter [Planctomycetota bacterium]